MKPEPVPYIKKVKEYVPGKPIEEVRREMGLKNVYKLASNENPFGCSPSIKKNINNLIAGLNRYPESSCYYLRRAMAKELGVKDDRLLFGNGSDELIVLTLRSFVKEGDEVVIADPTFLIYPIQSQVQGAKIKAVKLKDFKYDLKGMLKSITSRTKVVFIANPDNPTGAYLCHKELKSFLEKVPERVIVFIDEAYYDYACAKKDYPRTLLMLKNMKNIIVSRTFSKAYGLAALRVGYAVTSREVATVMNKAREPFNVNSFAQRCALLALKDKKFLRKVITTTLREKKILCRELKKMNIRFLQTETNFIPVCIGEEVNAVCKALLKRGVIVRNISGGWGMKGFMRVTVGKPSENRIFLRELRRVL